MSNKFLVLGGSWFLCLGCRRVDLPVALSPCETAQRLWGGGVAVGRAFLRAVRSPLRGCCIAIVVEPMAYADGLRWGVGLREAWGWFAGAPRRVFTPG